MHSNNHHYGGTPYTGDFIIIGTMGEVRISYENPNPEVVAVHFHVDSIAQEGNETFVMELVPSHSLMRPSGESAFFCNKIDMMIFDSDSKQNHNVILSSNIPIIVYQ